MFNKGKQCPLKIKSKNAQVGFRCMKMSSNLFGAMLYLWLMVNKVRYGWM